MQPRLHRPARSSGQPAPAGIEPGPLEAAEGARAHADDDLRGLLADEALEGRAEGIAENPPSELDLAANYKEYLLQSGQRHWGFSVAGNVPVGGVNRLVFPDEVASGYLYIVRAIRVQAPAGASLALYENAIAPDNFREVVPAATEASVPCGGLVFRGPTQILAVISKTTAEGLALVRLDGDLVQREPVDW